MSTSVDALGGANVNWSGRGLEVVPLEDLPQDVQVREMDLSHNNIKALTLNFAMHMQLPNLAYLDLGRNFLDHLPKNFGLLVNLRHLDLRSNKICSLPISMASMTQLVWLDLQDNPVNGPLTEVVGQFWSAKDCRNAAKSIVAFMSQVAMFLQNSKDSQNNNCIEGILQDLPDLAETLNEKEMLEQSGISTGDPSFNVRFINSIIGPDLGRRKKQGWHAVLEWTLRTILLTMTSCLLLMGLLALVVSSGQLRELLGGSSSGGNLKASKDQTWLFKSIEVLVDWILSCHEFVQTNLQAVTPLFPLMKEKKVITYTFFQRVGMFFGFHPKIPGA